MGSRGRGRAVKRINPFPIEERDAILTYVREKCRHWYAFVLVAFATGMRPSELCGLLWGDVDLRHATVDVRRSRTYHENHEPKTGASERVVRLPAHVVAVLRDAMPLHVDPDDFGFEQPSGKPVHGESFQKHEWQKDPGGASRQGEAEEVLQHAPHVRVAAPDQGRPGQVRGRAARDVAGDAPKQLRQVHVGRHQPARRGAGARRPDPPQGVVGFRDGL